jgi:hypothetical protein
MVVDLSRDQHHTHGIARQKYYLKEMFYEPTDNCDAEKNKSL